MYRRNTADKVDDDQEIGQEQIQQQKKVTKNFASELQSNSPNVMPQKQLQSGSNPNSSKNIEKERLMQEQIQKMKISEKEKLEAH